MAGITTKSEWLARVAAAAENLRSLIGEFHPWYSKNHPEYPITAQAAENACNDIRNEIRRENKGDPIVRFNAALTADNIGTLMSLLNEAWFGVPESTACWRIKGFKEAVDLLDDPPEEDEES